VLSGAAMYFSGNTDRLLETSDLNLHHATSVACVTVYSLH